MESKSTKDKMSVATQRKIEESVLDIKNFLKKFLNICKFSFYILIWPTIIISA